MQHRKKVLDAIDRKSLYFFRFYSNLHQVNTKNVFKL